MYENCLVAYCEPQYALLVHRSIPEFDDDDLPDLTRLEGKDSLSFVAEVDGEKAAYLIGYDRYDDGSWYCWMGGVVPQFRRSGLFHRLMHCQEVIAFEEGYTSIKVKTRGMHTSMQAYLQKDGFELLSVEERENPLDNRMFFQKDIRV
jgi:ribosomal protein S18 acetylase RimI-like enzyme